MKKLSKSKARKCGINVFNVLDRRVGHNRDSENSLYNRAVQIPCVCLFNSAVLSLMFTPLSVAMGGVAAR